MDSFKKYRRKDFAELREVTHIDIQDYAIIPQTFLSMISVSKEDLKAGSPKLGDMIARNPKNHNDMWLVAEKYFEDNFEKRTKEATFECYEIHAFSRFAGCSSQCVECSKEGSNHKK